MACFGVLPVPPVTSHLRVGGRGAELVEISLFAEDICFEGSKDPGGTVLKAKKQRAITLPITQPGYKDGTVLVKARKEHLMTFLGMRNEQNIN